jgi:uncharacterized protein YutE (UPF0331/DUF86 family)
MLNENSITLRLERLDESIRRLKQRQGISLEEYRADWEAQDVVERNFQVAIECCSDIASHLLVSHGLQRPATRRDVFLVLADAGVIDAPYAETMAQMVQLRNRLVHLYWDVDPERMHHYLRDDVAHLERWRAFTAGILEKERSTQEE